MILAPLCFALLGSTPLLGSPQSPPAAPRATLHGLVKDDSGKPLAQTATVSVAMRRDDGQYQQLQTRSSGDGSWKLETESGWKVLEVWARAKGRAQGHAVLERVITPGENPALDILVPAGTTLSGSVVDKVTQRPLAGARVWAESWQWDESLDSPTTHSDAQGNFVLSGLMETRAIGKEGKPEVRFDVHAEAADHAALRTEGLVFSAADAQRYTTRLELIPSNCEIQGVVNYAENGEPCEGSFVALIDELGQYRVTTTSAGGGFSFEKVNAGKAMLWAWPLTLRPDRPAPLSYGRDSFNVMLGQNAAVLWLEPVEGTQITGQVVAESNSKRAVPKVVLRRGLARGTLVVYLDEKEIEPDASGKFVARDVLPGRYQVELRFPESASQTLTDPRTREVEVDLGKNPEPVELRHAQPILLSGRIEGADVDTRFAMIEYSRVDQDSWTSVRPGPDGKFNLESLWPARWRVRLRSQGWTGPDVIAGPENTSGLVLKPKP